MQLLVYILFYPLLWLISVLPFWFLYKFSNLCYYFVYYIIGYRKKTVKSNLKIAFPNLTKEERLKIEKKSYRHLCDMFLEMIKTMSISPEEMRRRFKISNIELLQEYEKKNKSIILLASHYASWEWLLTINHQMKFRGISAYKKIRNKYFDKLVNDIRTKYNAELIEAKKMVSFIAENQKTNSMCLYGLASDQSPKLDKIMYWSTFMGVKTPVHTGAEMLAKRYDLEVVMVKVKKVKRGFYEATFMPITKNPKDEPKLNITNKFLREVEKQIIEAPEYYFWTHKRWKHKKGVESESK